MKINENNRFYINRKAIGEIEKAQGVTLDIACTIFAKEHWGDNGWQAEMNEFKAMVRYYEQAKDKPEGPTKHLDKNGDGHINVADLFA